MITERDSTPAYRAKFSSLIFACVAAGAFALAIGAYEDRRPISSWLFLAAYIGSLVASIAVRRPR
jgi:hypothetical protein